MLKESSQYNKTSVSEMFQVPLLSPPYLGKLQFNIRLSPPENPVYQTANTFLYILN